MPASDRRSPVQHALPNTVQVQPLAGRHNVAKQCFGLSREESLMPARAAQGMDRDPVETWHTGKLRQSALFARRIGAVRHQLDPVPELRLSRRQSHCDLRRAAAGRVD